MLLAAMSTSLVSALDLTTAHVVAPAGMNRQESKAVQMLVEEVEKRSQIQLPTIAAGPGPAITISRGRGPAEGYAISVASNAVSIAGNDPRGILFGVGRLLREMHLTKGRITVDDGFKITTAPKYPLRGHQLGYRPKTNAYDAWSVPIWDQYMRDLAVFGANAVELIPPRSDDASDSPHFPLPPMRMMTEMSRIADDYGLDVWIWYPAMDKDYSDPKTVEFALHEWGEVFKRLPRIDAIFVPGGDPGHTQPKYMMALLEQETRVLHQYHPKAQMWMSPQSFDAKWMDEFYGIMDRQPAWLTGIVFGPQQRVSLPELRARIPKKYPIRNYPDITHSRQAQFPVPDWDVAYALTEGREVINPRPRDEANIFRVTSPDTIGFLTYSEGCNDDVNKFVWSALGWDPDANLGEVLRQFSRYFIADEFADDFAQGLFALERNWRGPLATNDGVYTTLEQFQGMERRSSPQVRLNWRFQQGLYRAYYDGYVRRRLLHETEVEQAAMDALRSAQTTGAAPAMNQAEDLLDRSVPDRVAEGWRARAFELAEALFQSIRMQLSVEKYRAISVDRGASLDTIDAPLNDRLWLKQRFAEIRAMPNDPDRLAAINEIVNWTDPGPGGFYDDLGNLTAQPHLVRGVGPKDDPAFLKSSLVGFGARRNYRRSITTHAESLGDSPLSMHYDDLDPSAQYKIRVTYAGDSPGQKIRLTANESTEIHPYIAKPVPYHPIEFDLPRSVTANGQLTLQWTRQPGQGGNGRGCQVAEVWLIKK